MKGMDAWMRVVACAAMENVLSSLQNFGRVLHSDLHEGIKRVTATIVCTP
jgi:hypothetical protein